MGNKLTISPWFCILWALNLLILPLRWTTGALLAALIHEAAHIAAIRLCKGHILSVTIGGHGAIIEASPMTRGRESLCALAGPLGSFSVLLMSEYFPEAAVWGLLQGLYNLLPIDPLDGGRVIRSIFPESVCFAAEIFIFVFLGGIAFWIGTKNVQLGIITVLAVLYPLIRGKIACKESKQAVQ